MARLTHADAYRALEQLIADVAALAGSDADGAPDKDQDEDWDEIDRTHKQLSARLAQRARDAGRPAPELIRSFYTQRGRICVRKLRGLGATRWPTTSLLACSGSARAPARMGSRAGAGRCGSILTACICAASMPGEDTAVRRCAGA